MSNLADTQQLEIVLARQDQQARAIHALTKKNIREHEKEKEYVGVRA